jgi:hypothetical protein
LLSWVTLIARCVSVELENQILRDRYPVEVNLHSYTLLVRGFNCVYQLEPANLNTGITIVGKRARIPAGATIGRNCRIDSSVTPDNFERMEIPSGGAITRRSF